MRRAVFNIKTEVIRLIVVGWFCFTLMAEVTLASNYSLSYSGRLTQQSGAAVEGSVDIQVSFWNGASGGAQRGETLTYLSTELNQGVFALNLDLRPDQVKAIFGDGTEAVFVEISAAGKVYPRQQYLYVPFALRVPTDNTTLAFNDDGKLGFAGASAPTPNSYLSADGSGKLKWVALEAGALSAKTADNFAPSTGQVLTYNGNKWIAAAGSSGTGGSGGSGGTVTSVSGTGPISVATGSTTPVISMAQASGSASGYLSYGDWNAFNSKQEALGFVPVNKSGDTMSGALSVPLLSQSGTTAPSVAAAGQGSIYFDSGSNQFKVSQNGSAYAPLVSAASVTRVEAGTGLSGGLITTSGTISLANTTVTAGSYTRANFTVDQLGRLTSAASSPAIVDADISGTAAIAQSKISGLVSSLTGKEPSIAAGTTSQYWRGDKTWQTLNTTSVPEGSNQYFTVARAVSALTGSAPITYSTTTGNIAISKASGSIDGYLSASDWSAFNNKQDLLSYTPLNKAGDTMSGSLNMGGQPLTAVGNVVLSAAKTLGLGVFDNTSEPLMTAQLNSSGASSPDKGKTWFNSSTNQIKYWDGSSAQALGVSGAGLTSLNGQSGSTQSFQVNNSGSAPAINSGSNTHTLSIPNASSSGVTGGVISNADYTSFSNKIGSVAGASGISVVNSGGTATVSFASAGSAGTYVKVTTNAQGQVTSGGTLVAADIPGIDASKITGGQLATTNGGTGISSTATFPSSGVIVTEAAPETLINKTLTAATINGASNIGGSTSITTTGTISSGAATLNGDVTLQGSGNSARKLILNDGGNSKYLALRAPDTVATSTTWILPSSDGTGGQVLATNGSGTLGWASGLAPTGVAGGDLGGSFPNPTVSSVNGVTAANVAAGASLANAATNANTASTIVKRDSSGNFAAGTITANLTGNVTGNLTGNASTATSAGSFTGSLAGDVTGVQGVTVVGTVGGVTAANLATGANLANAATNANTVSTIVKRDASGNFSAGTITANLTGTASTATTAGSFTGSLAGDVNGTQGTTVVSTVGTSSAANIHSAELAANAASSANSALAIIRRDSNGGFSSGQISALTPNATTQGLIVKGSASQSVNLQEWQSSTGAVMSAVDSSGYLKLKDSDGTDNYVSLRASPTMASNLTYTLPGTVSAGAYLTIDGSGNMSWSVPGSFTGSLAGDVTGTQGATVVASVGGVTAANVAAGTTLANAATNANTVSSIVKRDASGNFAAGTITGNLTGNVTGNSSTATSAGSFTGSLAGDVTGTQGSTVVANVGGVTAANVSAGATLANAATNLNTASTIVKRDASGNLAAGTVTANVTGNVTGNLTGNVTGNVSGTAANVTGTVVVANGGTGATTLAANNVLLGNGTSELLTVAPGASGNVLMSNGTTWASSTPTTNWAAPGVIGATTPNSAAFTSFTASGNVGIGTMAPSDKMHVFATTDGGGITIQSGGAASYASGININNYAANKTASLGLANSSNNYVPGTVANDTVLSAPINLLFATAAGEKMRVSSSGNVGIGTTSPASTMETVGVAHVHDASVGPDNGYNGALRVTRAAATGQYINLTRMGNYVWSLGTVYNTNNFAIGTGQATDSSYTSPFFTINTSGNVGIGTAAPFEKAFIQSGNIGISSANSNGSSGWTHGGIVWHGYNRGLSNNSAAIFSGSTTWDDQGYLSFQTSGDAGNAIERLRITETGNVGIGTTSPAAALEVNGAFIRTIAHASGTGAQSNTAPAQIAGRTLTFTKSKSSTSIRIGWTDGVRVGFGTDNSACRYEIKVDGSSCSGGAMVYEFFMGAGAYIDHHRPQTLVGYCDGLGVGSHTLTLWVGPVPGWTQGSCYTGWNSVRWVLEAEEIN